MSSDHSAYAGSRNYPTAHNIQVSTEAKTGAPLSLQQQHYEQHYHQEYAARSPTPDSRTYDMESAGVGHGEHNVYGHAQPVEGMHHDVYAQEQAGNTHPEQPRSKGALFRAKVMSMATVRTLRILWGLLALFGTMSWLSLMPAYAFRNKHDPNGSSNPAFSFFLVATVCTSIAAIWQSLCPFLIERGHGTFWPRIIDHAVTQAATIVISAILTILNFFSWIVLAANKEGGKADCGQGDLDASGGYGAQCTGVKVAIAFDAIVFLLWIPIALVIVCGLIETMKIGHRAPHQGTHPMKEEYDLKRADQDYDESADSLPHAHNAYVTPIASQFALPEGGEAALENGESRQSSQSLAVNNQRQKLRHKNSQTSLAPSLADRLSGIFGAGWNSGPMPPPAPAPEPEVKPQQPPRAHQAFSKAELEESEPDKAPIHGDAYVSQWHSRRYDDWS
ncbi:MAG: hypothetical protein J3Q66DRAFT_322346 [Benniella sp.]|nr:MAG: hypothetical protein J3Q66DRAFT_322346 [Benniella sp.]